jgi:hypothetical protein
VQALIRVRAGFLVLISIALLAVTGGCDTSSGPPPDQDLNLKSLAVLYLKYRGSHNGQTPPDEASFKKFVEEEAAMPNSGIANANELFTSKRDNQPYVIIYGVMPENVAPPDAASDAPPPQPIIAYEKTGAGGTRFVATVMGLVEELSEEQFRQRVLNAP